MSFPHFWGFFHVRNPAWDCFLTLKINPRTLISIVIRTIIYDVIKDIFMAVPEHIRKVPRPRNTVVIDSGSNGAKRLRFTVVGLPYASPAATRAR